MTEEKHRGFDVFISYSTKDVAAAALIKHQLEASGLRCWKAPDDVIPGESWPTSIMRALGICRSMVLVWSRNSMTSSEVSKELTLAMKNGIAVIPLRLEDVEPRGDWAYHLANTHWMDAFPGALEPYVSELGQRLRGLLGEDSTMRKEVVAAAPARRTHLGRWLIPIGMVGLILAMGWWLIAGADAPVPAVKDAASLPQANVDNEAVLVFNGKVGKLDAVFMIEWDDSPNSTLHGHYYYPSRGRDRMYRLVGNIPEPDVLILQEFTPKSGGGETMSSTCRLTKRLDGGRTVWEGTMRNTDGRVLPISFSRNE